MKRVTAINGLPADETQSLSIETTGLVFISNHIPVELKEGDYDAYCLIYWAKYLGKLNKRKVFEWQSLAQEASEKGLRVKVLLVNADYQSFWGLEAGDLPEFAF